MLQNSNFRLLRGHRFRPKLDLTVMAPNHRVDTLLSILGPMGSHWVQKWVTIKNYHAPKFEFSTTQRSSISAKIWLYGYGAKSRRGPPSVSIMVPMGPIGSKKWVKTVKNYHVPEDEFSTTQRSLILAKIRLDGYVAKSWWGHPGVHLGANGVPLGPKNGSKP